MVPEPENLGARRGGVGGSYHLLYRIVGHKFFKKQAFSSDCHFLGRNLLGGGSAQGS